MGYHSNVRNTSKIISSSDLLPIDLETRAFTQNGEVLGERARLVREYVRLQSYFAHDVDFKYEKYHAFGLMIAHIGNCIDEYYDLEKVDVTVLKKMIVYIGLQIGCSVSYYTIFDEMKRSGELKLSYTKLSKNGFFNAETLYYIFKYLTFKYGTDVDSYKLYIDKELNNVENIVYNQNEEELNFYKNVNPYKTVTHELKSKIFEKYVEKDLNKMNDMIELLENLEDKYLSVPELDDSSSLFVMKVISYFECLLNSDYTFESVYNSMINSNEIDEFMSYETLKALNLFDLKYLEKRFIGNIRKLK